MIKQAAQELDEEKELPDGSAAADLARALPLYQDIAGPNVGPGEIRAYTVSAIYHQEGHHLKIKTQKRFSENSQEQLVLKRFRLIGLV